ncbi:MAG: hypothetical protein GXX85_16700 [Ignavibacteria bacterium]|nr:hypothetical protein [Ignavibacteria bacterium]
MKSFFKIICIAAAILFVFLGAQLLFIPEDFIRDMGLTPDVSSIVLAKRVSIFMFGFATLLFLSRNISVSKARTYINISMLITFFLLAFNGISGFINGYYNSSIFIAITIESLFGIAFIVSLLLDNKNK